MLLSNNDRKKTALFRTSAYWVGVYVLALLAFQELAFRFIFPLPDVSHFNRINYMPIGPEGAEVNAIRSIKVMNSSSPDNARFIHTLNAYGFRDKNWKVAKEPDVERIFFVGDSFVQGDMANDNETIPRTFEDKSINQQIQVEAMNFGVDGGSLLSYADLVLDATPIFKPDWIFLVLYANDLPDDSTLCRTIPPTSYNLLVPRLFQLITLLTNKEMLPFRYPWRTLEFDQAVPSPNNPWSDKEFEQTSKQYVTPQILLAMKRGEFNPFRIGGSLYLEEALQNDFDITPQLTYLQNFLQIEKTRLCVVYIPERGQVSNYYRSYEKEYSIGMADDVDMTDSKYQLHQQLLSKQCGALGIPFLDLTNTIKTEEKNSHHLYWHYDDHLRAEGYKLVGEAMFDWWRVRKSQGLIK